MLAVLLHIVVAVVRGYGCHIVALALENCACSYAAGEFSSYTVAVSLGITSRIHEESLFNSGKIAAHIKHLFHEQYGALLELSRLFSKVAILFELDHVHKSVKAYERLLSRVARLDIVYVPRHVPAFVGRYCRLYVSACKLAYDHVEHMRYRRFARTRLNVLCVHLGAHTVLAEYVAQSDRIR